MTPPQFRVGISVYGHYVDEKIAGTIERIEKNGDFYVHFVVPHLDLGDGDLFNPADVSLNFDELDEPEQVNSEFLIATAPIRFRDRASIGLKYGIPVIPLRGKAPFLSGWQNAATTDPAQIEKWNGQFPDANCGLVAKAQPAGFWCLEVDSPD